VPEVVPSLSQFGFETFFLRHWQNKLARSPMAS
jgi:hypothetical protein